LRLTPCRCKVYTKCPLAKKEFNYTLKLSLGAFEALLKEQFLGGSMVSRKGFTLLELMIVVAIIAALSAFSVPSLMRYAAKAKRTEAYLYLRTLAHAQKAYFVEHGTYTKKIGAEGLRWKPEGPHQYTYGFSGGAAGETHYVGQSKAPTSLLSGASLSREGFTIYAAAYIYQEIPDILSIDQNNEIKLISDALA
jgi:prepilin-type N-terminal cleavage/methylation domain-containing protein